MTEHGEHYVAVPMRLLEALRALWREPPPTDLISVDTARLIIRAVTTDPVSGNLVLGIRLHRDLDDNSGSG